MGLWVNYAKLYVGAVGWIAQMAFALAQAPNCYVLPVSRYDDWQVENLVGVTDNGMVAGTLVYRGQDSSVRIRRIPFRWSIQSEQLEILPPPVNDPESEHITGIIANDLSIDGSAIVGKITYSGYNRPSAAFLWKAGMGYQIVKTQRIGSGANTREIRVALSAVAVGHSGYHIVIQPEEGSSFVIAELPTPAYSRCPDKWLCNEMKVVAPKCRYGFLESDEVPYSEELMPEIYLEMEVFSDTDSQPYSLRWYIPRFDLPNWWRYILDWWRRRFPPTGSSVRVLVNDISQDGQWIVGSVEIPEGNNTFCYQLGAERYTLPAGEYIMRGRRYSAWGGHDWGYGPETCDHYVVEIKPYYRGRRIQGKATAIGEYYNPSSEAFCTEQFPSWCAGLVYDGQDRNSLFLWNFSPPIGGEDFFRYEHDGLDYCCQNVVSVRGVDAVGEVVGAGRDYQGDTKGYISRGYFHIELDIEEPWGPIPAVSTCKEVVAISPSGRFMAVHYTDTCDGTPRVFAVIDRVEFLTQRPSQAIVAFRNLTFPNRSVPYYSGRIEVRLFLQIGNRWYSQHCDEEMRRSRWYITGTLDENYRDGGEPSPENTGTFNNNTNNRTLSSNILSHVRELPREWDYYQISWYWLHHAVDLETSLSEIASQPCPGDGWRRYYYYPPYEPDDADDYVFSLIAGTIPVLPQDVSLRYYRDRVYECHVGTARLEARVAWWEEENGRRVRKFIRSRGPKPGGYRPRGDNSPDAPLTWSQNCDEALELALRISVRAGETVVGWATSFLGVPHEMGGGWYGGRADNDWDSSDNDCGRDYRGDHQYGIDCNGLIWSSFNLAGISGFPRRIGASAYITDPRFVEVDLSDIQRGDILASGGHVMMVYSVDESSRSSKRCQIRIIESRGAPAHRVRVVQAEIEKVDRQDKRGTPYRIRFSRNSDWEGYYFLRRWRGR
jgi:hypothetical protein